MKSNIQLYILFGGFIYFAINVVIIMGYACGYIGHILLTPFEAIRTLIIISFVIAIITPVVRGSFKSFVGPTCFIMFMVMVIVTALFNFLCACMLTATV